MSISLLATKLYIPPSRSDVVSRPYLVQKLRQGLDQPGSFVLLSAPAGFGKTTLLSEFAAQLRAAVAWLSLDEGDNDPGRFWSYLIAALQAVQQGIGESALALLGSPQPPPDEAIAMMLINDIAESGSSLILILDDYHTLQNTTIHSAFVFLLEHLPVNLHILIATRIDPPWPLARFRARNQMIEIRVRELRFTPQEAASFLNRVMGLKLSADDVAALEERTEGWAAGLQLAALSMRGREDIPAFVKVFTGSHVYIAEYLVEEVLRRQPEEVQEFLLRTSILERLNAGLCEAVTGRENGQTTLTDLYRANLFVVSLDDEGAWFRYHHLFADLLKARLQKSLSKAGIAELHRRAAEWYEQAGMAPEAVDHALAARDYAHLVRLVEQAALPAILQANVGTVDRWLQAIPAEYVEKSPRINMAYAWMNLLRGALPQAVPYIDRLKSMFSAPGSEPLLPALRCEWLAIQSEYLIAQGRPEEGRDLANQTLRMLADVNANVRRMVYLSLAKAFQLTFDYEQAADVFQMIALDARESGDFTFEILGMSGEAQMRLKQGRLRRGFEVAMEGIRRLEASGKNIPFSATFYGELGQIHFYWHNLEEAKKYVRLSMEISGKNGYSDPEIYNYLTLSKMYLMDGDPESAAREMHKASRLAGLVPPAMIRANVLAQQVRTELAVDCIAAAGQLLAAEGFTFGESFRFPELDPGALITFDAGLLYNSALRVLLYQARKKLDRPELRRGIELAGRLAGLELKCQHDPLALETLLLRSQMYAVLGDREQSLREAARALELAVREGYISTFIEEGQSVADMLAELLRGGLPETASPEFVREILAAFPEAYQPAVKLPAAERACKAEDLLVEPLTQRELEVLRLIAAGDSNRTIAEKLVITVSAVKKHSGNIFGKLNVSSRTQAVARARQLNLLAPDY